MIKCLKDTGFWWPKKPPNAGEVKFNSIYPKVAVQWLNQVLCLVDSEVLLNYHLRVASKRVFDLNRILKSNSYKPERIHP